MRFTRSCNVSVQYTDQNPNKQVIDTTCSTCQVLCFSGDPKRATGNSRNMQHRSPKRLFTTNPAAAIRKTIQGFQIKTIYIYIIRRTIIIKLIHYQQQAAHSPPEDSVCMHSKEKTRHHQHLRFRVCGYTKGGEDRNAAWVVYIRRHACDTFPHV